jgi:hypothetical protein
VRACGVASPQNLIPAVQNRRLIREDVRLRARAPAAALPHAAAAEEDEGGCRVRRRWMWEVALAAESINAAARGRRDWNGAREREKERIA